MLKVSGYLVYPSAIEEKLRCSSLVEDCCVVGMDTPKGTRVKAYVVPRREPQNDQERQKWAEDITGFSREHLNLSLIHILSDGSLPPEDLVRLGQRLKLDVIAITDHDTLAGCRQAKDLEKGRQIRVIPGAEFSCVDEKRGRKVHLLCYGPKKLQVLEPICQEIGRRRREAVHQMIEKVAAHYPITQEMVERYAKDLSLIRI